MQVRIEAKYFDEVIVVVPDIFQDGRGFPNGGAEKPLMLEPRGYGHVRLVLVALPLEARRRIQAQVQVMISATLWRSLPGPTPPRRTA